jgi:hypothetical protein
MQIPVPSSKLASRGHPGAEFDMPEEERPDFILQSLLTPITTHFFVVGILSKFRHFELLFNYRAVE